MRPHMSRQMRWLASVAMAVALMFSLVPTGLANLPNSKFESSDGNLIVNTAGNEDWANAPNLVTGVDLPSGSSDNSFGQGAKEDIPGPSVVLGSIPPNKSDLTRFYVASENMAVGAQTQTFLYLAWERSNILGSANIDFEFNQSSTTDVNGVTPVRSPGDVLITFDFVNGGGNPVLGLLRWVTAGATSQCYANNSLPCWGNRVDLSAAGFAEGAVNTASVVDPLSGVTLPGLTFGEAGINLTTSNVLPAGQCVGFGRAFVKSRSSASFTAELKDFIAPIPVTIKNCGTIIIRKQTVPSGAAGSFAFATTGGLSPATFSLAAGGVRTYNNVQPGSYSVAENDPAPAFDLTNLICTATGTGTSATPTASTRTALITLAPGGVADCTYTNSQRGKIVVRKVTDPATDTTTSFSFNAGGGLTPASFSLTNGGTQAYANVPLGSGYSVSEVTPTGWDLASASCSDGSPTSNITVSAGAVVTCTFTNRARGTIAIHKQDDAGNALQGAVFTLFTDNPPLGGTPPHGSEDTQTAMSCTTNSSGDCSIQNVIPGPYWAVETTGVTGYGLAVDQSVIVGAGQTKSLTFVDPRQFRIIVLVCRESDNTLYPSTITVDGVNKTSLGPGGGGSLGDATLCALGGARYSDVYTGTHPASDLIP